MQKRILTEYRKLPKEIKMALKAEYPLGFENVLTTIKMVSDGSTTSAFLYSFNDILYLIKYKIKKRIDNYVEVEDEEDENDTDDEELDLSTGDDSYDDEKFIN